MITNEIKLRTSSEIAAYVGQLTTEIGATKYCDRRSEPRFAVDLSAEVTPLNELLESQGATFEARVRDISASGMRLAHSEAVYNGYLAVALDGNDTEDVPLIMEILWCRRCGDHYDIGGRMVTG